MMYSTISKSFRRAAVLISGVFLIFPAIAFSSAPPVTPYVSSPDPGQALVSGTSTLHNWTVKSSIIKGTAAFTGNWKAGATPPIALQSIELVIPVDSLKSTEGSGMDNTMYDAMKLKQFPTITYKLTKATLKSPPAKEGETYSFDTTGGLTVAGVLRPVSLDLEIVSQDDGRITIATDIGLKMSAYGITPPTAMLGMIKSGAAITVKVNWQLTTQPPTATAAK
jgi:polyisoprenoid-binding protein YceI